MNFYCTGDAIGIKSGGGAVTFNEMEALQELGDVVVFSQREALAFVENLDSPFLFDYFATLCVENMPNPSLAHFYSWAFPMTVRRLKEKGCKVAYTVPAHDRKVTVEEFEKLGLRYPFEHIKNDMLWRIFKQGYVDADVVIAPSNASACFLEEEGCRNVVVIPHGCDIPERLVPPPDGFHVGYLGQIGPDKGLHYLIKAWELLGYEKGPTLIIAGPNTEVIRPLIEQNVGRGDFKLWGFIDSPSTLYNAVSVYIQPSVCESFGIEILEALAHGRPVVASEGAGASELIKDGETGFVVPIRDHKAMADKIDWLKRNPQKAREMGQKGREVAKNYIWDKIHPQYLETWRKLLR